MFKIFINIFWGIKENVDQDSRSSQSRKVDFQISNYNTVMTAKLEVCSLHSGGTEEKVPAARFQVLLKTS